MAQRLVIVCSRFDARKCDFLENVAPLRALKQCLVNLPYGPNAYPHLRIGHLVYGLTLWLGIFQFYKGRIEKLHGQSHDDSLRDFQKVRLPGIKPGLNYYQ